jgi:hypothetical protein
MMMTKPTRVTKSHLQSQNATPYVANLAIAMTIAGPLRKMQRSMSCVSIGQSNFEKIEICHQDRFCQYRSSLY